MNVAQDEERLQLAFRRLKAKTDLEYPKGRFLAFAPEGVLADGPTFQELCRILRAEGKDPRELLIAQAGEHYPESAVNFLGGLEVMAANEFTHVD